MLIILHFDIINMHCLKISSRTMHIDWDSAGCLCPVGDFFNYAAPGEENSEDQLSSGNGSRLIDAGFEEDLTAYCFYARRNYRKGEQVFLAILLLNHITLSLMNLHLEPLKVNDNVTAGSSKLRDLHEFGTS